MEKLAKKHQKNQKNTRLQCRLYTSNVRASRALLECRLVFLLIFRVFFYFFAKISEKSVLIVSYSGTRVHDRGVLLPQLRLTDKIKKIKKLTINVRNGAQIRAQRTQISKKKWIGHN